MLIGTNSGGDFVITISLCMIVRNEAETLAACLNSVRDIVDEIILVDTGSEDNTKDIARNYTDKIIDFEWIDDFSAARNFSFQHATMDYVLWLDADDVLLEPDREKFMQLKATLSPTVDSVTMIYHYAFDDHGNPTLSFRRNRLVKRTNNFRWFGVVHEYLAVNGNILNSDIVVTHRRVHAHSGRNLAIFEQRLSKGENFSSRDLFYYANELLDNKQDDRALEVYTKFLKTEDSWVEDKIAACDRMADIYFRLGQRDKERECIYKAFEYDVPRAEFCCRLGFQFLERNQIKQAIFWYKLATELEKPSENWGFFHEACWTWLPHIQLCICYYKLGDYAMSYHHNELARAFRPSDEQILGNKSFLEKVIQEQGQVHSG
jgi:glycosyltransferase involved in cell wall biosynthesis